jgi:hypothetical protein
MMESLDGAGHSAGGGGSPATDQSTEVVGIASPDYDEEEVGFKSLGETITS